MLLGARVSTFQPLAASSQSWGSCEDLANAMKDAFESFINVRQNKPAEYMAKFLDAQVCAAATSRTRSGGWRPALARKTGQGRPRQGTMEETRARLPSASQRGGCPPPRRGRPCALQAPGRPCQRMFSIRRSSQTETSAMSGDVGGAMPEAPSARGGWAEVGSSRTMKRYGGGGRIRRGVSDTAVVVGYGGGGRIRRGWADTAGVGG